MAAGAIRVGIGGWDYEPWRETFYPPGLPKAKQLEHAARHVTAIEINATYYKLQSPDLFARWAKAVPDGFKFALKGSRYCSNRRLLAEGGEAVARFCGQGFTELGDRLGPIVWQLMATKRFDPDDMRGFLALLPREVAGVRLSHAIEVRHESFRDPAFVAMARAAGVAIVFGDGAEFPCFADLSGDIAYARLMGARSEEPAGYSPAELDRWAAIASAWAAGESPADLPYAAEAAPVRPRDTYVFMINGAKERAPAAAMALLERL
ncbi:DUF72 domain-containing protein [Sphingomonas parva]|uniref:DUF72 domain-containing protein n=1 Tax=Sphingomonas parva TaxID=2555898 RepID=A0A4Y8ZN55_9SPHN|nr:DUF72 domain-containing protein [Sphingomonas parva]TFI56887.1 DUF72 domain-containing protein [Sphingomonas parva]